MPSRRKMCCGARTKRRPAIPQPASRSRHSMNSLRAQKPGGNVAAAEMKRVFELNAESLEAAVSF